MTIIRRATVDDIANIARHRTQMFLAMGRIAPATVAPLAAATIEYLSEAMPGGEYHGWMAVSETDSARVVAGAGVQLRHVLPFAFADGTIAAGRQGIVVNVFTEPEARRGGVARALMDEVMAWAQAERLDSLVLHASNDGRPLYEAMGFVATNEMRFVGDLNGHAAVVHSLPD